MLPTKIEMDSFRIAPSILASDFSRLAEQIKLVEQAGIDWIHLDIMDGHFVPNISFGIPVIESVRKVTKATFDTHLMIEHPERYLKDFRAAGSDIITVHQEVCPDLTRVIEQIHQLGAKAGVAVNPDTPLSTLSDIVPLVDLILIMSVHPGFGGQQFIQSSYKKLETARQMIHSAGKSIYLEIDGGVDATNIAQCVKAGADVLVAGTSVFRQPNIPAAVKNLRKVALAA